MKKKIVLVNQDSGYLSIDIANAFAKGYDEIVLMTGYLVSMDSELSEKIKVHNLYKYNRKSTLTRAISWIFATIQVFFNVLTKYRKYELFFSTNPPTIVFLLAFLKKRCFSLLVLDLYPDAIHMGNFTKNDNFIIKFWTSVNRKYLKYAKSLVTLTSGMADSLSNYVDKEKIKVIPAWSSGFNLPDYSTKDNPFVVKYGFQDKFIVMYSGNLGKEHEVEALVDLAEQLKDNNDIMIVIAGQGWKYKMLNEEIEQRKLNNCQLLPKQSVELFLAGLAATNLGVVSLSQSLANVSIPSKTFNLLGAGTPILCIGGKDSDLSRLLESSKTGDAFTSNHINEMAAFVQNLKDDKNLYAEYCENAIQEAKKFTSANADQIREAHMSASK
ncbi:glycosyltransferase family 4 protein [Carboxylicivirga sp. N1Y90]|uniref:glycosyltransferase family 4 protein n=1 Tax=Carboxylicivirga fragile TaxID=3417571 RepID=UPI003D344A7B|nr:glycosyltransferase family 4 protein [Marinilabiliaceae bacterium N1Y90]